MIRSFYKSAKAFFEKYERYMSPLAMAVGFVLDNVTLRRVDLPIDNLIISIYLSIVTFCIIYIHAYRKKMFQKKSLNWLYLFCPVVMQFFFGGLFSVFTVFYARSAAILVSWPFLLILFGMLLGNELFRKRYERLNFHLSVLFLAYFAYAVFALPLAIGRIGADVFLASGGASLLMILLVIRVLYQIDHAAVRKNGWRLSLGIAIVYLVFNVSYFANLIPPIPLAMKASGVYHDVSRAGNDYRLVYEAPPKREFWRETSGVFHWRKGDKVYVFSSIFAPTKFSQKIIHRWMLYDPAQKKWIGKSDLGFPIVGGRDGGYRGYSYKTDVAPGKWRVDVVTDRGQVLGREEFEIVNDAGNYELQTSVSD